MNVAEQFVLSGTQDTEFLWAIFLTTNVRNLFGDDSQRGETNTTSQGDKIYGSSSGEGGGFSYIGGYKLSVE